MKRILDSIIRALVSLMILELVFGIRGRILILYGIPIRYILFGITIIAVYIKMIYYIHIRKRENGCKLLEQIRNDISLYSRFDRILFAVLLMNFIWIFLVPYIMGTQIKEAILEMRHLYYMFFYFPAIYLHRIEKVQWDYYRKLAKFSAYTTVLLHIIIYAGEVYMKQHGANEYFVTMLNRKWAEIVHGNCFFLPPIMPKYSIRIIYSMNNVILLSFYFIMEENNRIKKIVWTILSIFALLTTGTRTVIVAPLIGACVYVGLRWVMERNRQLLYRMLKSILIAVVMTIAIDAFAFQGRTLIRLKNSFYVSQQVLESNQSSVIYYDSNDYSQEKEERGTINSNTTRIIQLRKIIENYQKNPIFGYGYGRKKEDNQNGISYENIDMQSVGRIMEIGLVGVSLYFMYLIYLLKCILTWTKKGNPCALKLFAIIMAYLFCSIFLYTFQSHSMLVILFAFLDVRINTNSEAFAPTEHERLQEASIR